MASDSEYSSYKILQATECGNIPWETVFNREELESHILQYNKDSFRAAADSPCGHGIIHDALTFTSLSPESEALLSGIIPDDWCSGSNNYLREFLASFMIPMHVRNHGDIPTGISDDDVIRGFKGWKEQTSTSPSGRHLGHCRALIQHPVLLKCFVSFMNIAVSRGIAIPRWCNATNVMIEKDIGKPCIHRLRIVHLFEADYNFFLKLQWGHRLVRQACDLDLLHPSQHDSILEDPLSTPSCSRNYRLTCVEFYIMILLASTTMLPPAMTGSLLHWVCLLHAAVACPRTPYVYAQML
jgi:hypothetical protein